MPRPDPDPATDSTPAAGASTRVVSLPIEQIRRDRDQARKHFDADALAELAASIAESGIVQPVVVRGDADSGYQLIAGERRWRAAQQIGLAALPALIRNDLSADDAAVLGLIENLQRESLGVMETAHGLARLGESHGLTHEAIASRIGKSRAYVSNFLRLRQLAVPVQTLLEEAQLSLGHAKVLAGLSSATQTTLARRAVARRASVRQLERWARDAADDAGKPATNAPPAKSDLGAIEQALSEHLGNAVRVYYEPDRRRGELRIAFHDLDEFEGLLSRMGYQSDS